MATPAQQLSLSTALLKLVKKLTSSPSMMSYSPLFIASRNTTFSSLMETWMPKLVKTETINSAYTTRQKKSGQHPANFTLENRLTYLNTDFQKREGKLWTYTCTNNTKAQIEHVFINKKWNNSPLNYEVYSSFEGVSSNHRIVTAKIRLSLRRIATRTRTTVYYDWPQINNRNIGDILH